MMCLAFEPMAAEDESTELQWPLPVFAALLLLCFDIGVHLCCCHFVVGVDIGAQLMNEMISQVLAMASFTLERAL